MTILASRNMRTFNGDVDKTWRLTLLGIIEWLNRHTAPYDHVVVGEPWYGLEASTSTIARSDLRNSVISPASRSRSFSRGSGPYEARYGYAGADRNRDRRARAASLYHLKRLLCRARTGRRIRAAAAEGCVRAKCPA